jgi:hypothetical protein
MPFYRIFQFFMSILYYHDDKIIWNISYVTIASQFFQRDINILLRPSVLMCYVLQLTRYGNHYSFNVML